jgi:transcriptional regulator with XRE-family HTH domain
MVTRIGVLPMSTPTHREATPGGAMAYIKHVREELGVQSKTVAMALGISPSHYSQMEGNASYGYLPPPDKLAIICGILRITQSEVIRAAGYLTDSPAAKRLDDDSDRYIADLDARVATLKPEDVQRELDEYTRSLMERLFPERRNGTQMTLGGV